MLVATTVIEVGVDVPNATIMVILDADRFGIAQLHQLRGRVGRGAHASRCWLVTQQPDADPPTATRGSRRSCASTDGFELAEIDLDLRGEGTLMSTAQKGRSDLKLASLRRDRELVQLARDAAFEIVDADPELAASPRAARRARPALHRRGRGLPRQVLNAPTMTRERGVGRGCPSRLSYALDPGAVHVVGPGPTRQAASCRHDAVVDWR